MPRRYRSTVTSDGRLLVLYDGECGTCTRAARWIERHDRYQRTRCVPLQETDPPAGTTRADLERELHVVDPDGRISAGWSAVLEIARQLPVLAWLPTVARIPGVNWLGTRAYRRIAKRRTCGDCVQDQVRSGS